MFHLGDSTGFWQNRIKIAAPPSRVIPCPVSGHSCPRQHTFDTSAQPRCSFVLCEPNWFKTTLYVRYFYIANQHFTDGRHRVFVQSRAPLFSVLWVFKFGQLADKEFFHSFGKCQAAFMRRNQFRPCGFFFLNRVDALSYQVSRLTSTLTRCRQGNIRKAPKPNVPSPITYDAPQQPRPPTIRGYLHQQPVNAADSKGCVDAVSRMFKPLNLKRR